MSGVDERQQLLNLPLPERTIAVALKQVFDQIKKIEEEEAQEIQKVHQSFIGQFKEGETKASKIIKGGPIKAQDLKNKQNYFSSDELPKVEGLIKTHKGIQAYWLVVFQNYFNEEDLSLCDKQIATAILDISTNVLEQKLELVFEIGNNPWLPAGKYNRAFILKDGNPEKVEGNKVNWLKKQAEGILPFILRDNLTAAEIITIFPTVGEIINEIVPYSLEYFLGAAGDDQEQLEEEEEEEYDDQQENDDEEQEDEGPAKKVKQ